jgi:VanZ family protein
MHSPKPAPVPLITRVSRSLFWLALVFASVMAVLPKPPHTPIDRFGDKFAHILAFTVLTVLANLGFPKTERIRIVERLCFLGAVIEVVQSIPELHRDCDIRDWVADSLAVLVVTTGFVLYARWQRSRRSS